MTTAWFNPSLGVNVADYGADPFGNNNSTAAFTDAKAAAGAGGTVHCPTGIYMIDPDFDFASRSWVGDVAADGAPRTTLRATGAGTQVIFSNTRFNLINLIIDAANLCTYCVELDHAHASIIWNCTTTRAITDGWFFNEPQVGVTWKCSALNNGGSGFRIVGTNNWNYYDLHSDNNGGYGCDVYGHLSGVTSLSGQMQIYGAQCRNNAIAQLRMSGVGNGQLAGIRTDGPGDGIIFRQNTHGISVDNVHIVDGGTLGAVAIRIIGSNMNVFREVNVDGSDEFSRILVESGAANIPIGVFRVGGALLPMEIEGGGGSFEVFDTGGAPGNRAPSVPSGGGSFNQGQLMWNLTPTAGSPLLWRCNVTGTPGTWETITK